MKFLSHIQKNLEDWYGVSTGLNIADFVVPTKNMPELGQLVVHREDDDLEIALLLDRDILAAFDPNIHPQGAESAPRTTTRALSVSFEEVSHFVYLSFNHHRRRNITALEMEMQSEVDRILLAFHGNFDPLNSVPEIEQANLLREVFDSPYPEGRYEEGRRAAAQFMRHLSGGDPRAWGRKELHRLRSFFHSDLSEKLALARTPR